MTPTDQAPAPEAPRDHGLEFRGSGPEYFRIWIVNLLLSILTLGIYSAWATVRNRRYLYGSTYLMDSAFDFHATGGQVLRGRLIAVAAVLAWVAAGQWAPPLQALLVLVLLPVLPWLVVQARRFRTFNTSWRNVRFGFDRAYGEAYKVFLLWPLTIPLTVGLIYPYILFRQQRFLADNARFGRERFRLDTGPGFFFGLIFGIGAVAFVAYVVLMVAFAGSMAAGTQGGPGEPGPLGQAGLVAFVIGFYGILVAARVAYRTFALNHVWSHARLGGAGFALQLRFGRMLWITLSNVALIVLTVGLFTPFAKVRMLRYMVSQATVTVADDDIRAIEADAAAATSAAGDEVADAFDLDVGIA